MAEVTRPVAILGGGGHARVVAYVCRATGLEVAGLLVPEAPAGELRAGLPVLGDDGLLGDAAFLARHALILGFGDQRRREHLATALREAGATLATAVHPRAVVAPGVAVGPGSVVIAGAVVNPGAALGEGVIVHANVTIDHDGRLAEGAQVCPGAQLAGGVSVERYGFVGTGAVVIPGRCIGAGATVAAGAVVIDDVPPGATVVGNPARVVSR